MPKKQKRPSLGPGRARQYLYQPAMDQQLPSRVPTSPAASRGTLSTVRSQPLSVGIMAATSNEAAQGMSGLLAERMAEGGGALCNDQNGLCLGSRGDIDDSKSGIYTAIAKLAGQLDSTVEGSGGKSNQQGEVPLVTIQTEKASLLVKEYGGRTVVFRCPNTEADKGGSASEDGEVSAGGQGGGADKTKT